MRNLLRLLLLAFAALPARTGVAQSALDHRELPADQQVIHALSRLTFGARPGDLQAVRSMGLDRWVETQLQPAGIDDRAMDVVASRYSFLRADQPALLRDFAESQQRRRMARREGDTTRDTRRMRQDDGAVARRAVVGQLQSARVARAVLTERQLQEVVTDFWLNHFSVFAQKGPPQPFYISQYEEAVRALSLGKFRELLGAVAKSPAMLFYLDNARSMGDTSRSRLASVNDRRGLMQRGDRQNLNRLRTGGLNENYARELLELHTLGVDGGYTQQDVIEVARSLSGWTIRQPAAGGGFVFRPAMHDAEAKTVLGVRLRQGRGIEDGEQVLDILAGHPSTATHIARKLATRLVSDAPPQALVDRAASTFRRTDGDIREVVRTIVSSNEFYSRSAYRSKVKSPFEVVVSALRAIGAEPDTTPRTARMIARIGQPIYGHQAPNGYPETGGAWMNTGAILNRINFGISVAAGRIPGARLEGIAGIGELRSAPRERQVDAAAAMLLGGSISADTRQVLMSGENPLLVRGSEPRPHLEGIAQVIGLALGSPEFQRR